MKVAITHVPSFHLAHCELTYVSRKAIDLNRALEQHDAYCGVLSRCGCKVVRLDANCELPDSTFVEDTAIVLDEVAVLASLRAVSRRLELELIESEVRHYREVQRITLPATLEGGDVLQIGKTILVGLSPRTNRAAVQALEAIVKDFGYCVLPVDVQGCLHFKTACTALDDCTMLVNSAWVDIEALQNFDLIAVPETEPWGANVVRVDGELIMAAEHVQTAEMVQKMGYRVHTADLSEFAKAEGGATCLSLIFEG